MTKSQTLPPDITVTRADVLALPNATAYKSPPMPEEGRSWHIERNSQGLAWVDLPAGLPFSQRAMWEDVHKIETARHLAAREADIAERAFLWQTALASDAALSDIGNDPAPSATPVPQIPASVPAPLADPAFWQGVAIGHGEALDSPDTFGGAFPQNDKRDPAAVTKARNRLTTIRNTLAEETRKVLHDLRMTQSS